MKAGIIGLPGSGKWTVFEVLTRTVVDVARKGESRLGTIAVPDPRVDALSDLYKPQKTTYAQVQYFLPGARNRDGDRPEDQGLLAQVRDCDALICVVRNFGGSGPGAPHPREDVNEINGQLLLADLAVAEKRIERIELTRDKGQRFEPDELAALHTCRAKLEDGVPLRHLPELASSPHLHSYSFLSAKPLLVLVNNGDEDDELPDVGELGMGERCIAMRGRLEHELAQMSEDEAAGFFSEYGITESAMGRVLRESYELLGLASFFTVGEDEVRAWTCRRGDKAPVAAGKIHADMERGFIRMEVMRCDDLLELGSEAAVIKAGKQQIEGKTYEIQEGDIVVVRFNAA